jgi:hypothetical protein
MRTENRLKQANFEIFTPPRTSFVETDQERLLLSRRAYAPERGEYGNMIFMTREAKLATRDNIYLLRTSVTFDFGIVTSSTKGAMFPGLCGSHGQPTAASSAV